MVRRGGRGGVGWGVSLERPRSVAGTNNLLDAEAFAGAEDGAEVVDAADVVD